MMTIQNGIIKLIKIIIEWLTVNCKRKVKKKLIKISLMRKKVKKLLRTFVKKYRHKSPYKKPSALPIKRL